MKTSIFKAYDIRGKVPHELNPATARAIGQAFGEWLPQAGVVALGRDMRHSSQELARAFQAGLASSGRPVWDLGEVTTDMLYFAVSSQALAGGAMVPASHNPGADNGIKLCREAARPVGSESGLAEVKERVLATGTETSVKELPAKTVTKDVRAAWCDHVLSFVPAQRLKGLKVAVDAGNGMAGVPLTSLRERLPLELVPLFFTPDGSFPNHPANPLVEATLETLKTTVLDQGCDAGVAFDGDGDRAVLVDETGAVVTPSVLSAFLSAYFLQQQPGSSIVYNAISSRIVPETIQAHGGQAVVSRVGHAFMKAKMRECDAVFGGEHSAHYYFRDNYYADSGLIAAVIVLGLLADSGQKLSELVAPYRRYCASGELNFALRNKAAKLAELARKFQDGEQQQLDGLSVIYPEWWFNLRASNTEDLLRLNVEADNSRILAEKTELLTSLIKE